MANYFLNIFIGLVNKQTIKNVLLNYCTKTKMSLCLCTVSNKKFLAFEDEITYKTCKKLEFVVFVVLFFSVLSSSMASHLTSTFSISLFLLIFSDP